MTDTLAAEVDRLSAARDAAVSVWMGTLDGTPHLEYRADTEHPAASTLKLPLSIAVERAIERGELAPEEALVVHDEFASALPGHGLTYRTTREYDNDEDPWELLGGRASVRWLIERALVMSSNLATNLLIERVGIPAVNAVYRDAGATNSRLRRGIQDAPAGEHRLFNTASAGDLAAVLVRLVSGRLVGAPATASLEATLARCRTNEAIPQGLPAGTYIAHKTGWIDGACHDVALVRPVREQPFVLSVFTGATLDDAALHALVADVAGLCWEHRA